MLLALFALLEELELAGALEYELPKPEDESESNLFKDIDSNVPPKLATPKYQIRVATAIKPIKFTNRIKLVFL